MKTYQRTGFTLIEIMIVIAVFSILGATLYPSVNQYLERSRNTKRVLDINAIHKAVTTYKIEKDVYPSGPGYDLNTDQEINSNLDEWEISFGVQLKSILPNFPKSQKKGFAYYYGRVYTKDNISQGGLTGSNLFGDNEGRYVLYSQNEGVSLSENFQSLTLSAKDSAIFKKEPGFTIKTNSEGKSVFSRIGYNNIQTSNLIPVDTKNKYKLAGDFRSVGTGGTSVLYYGFANYDKDKRFISAEMVYTSGNSVIISSFDNTKIIPSTPTDSGWVGNNTMAYMRSLGFYFDGNTNKLPDVVKVFYPSGCIPVSGHCGYNTDSSYGTYSTAGNEININSPLDISIQERIIPGVTKVRNHQSGGSYQYVYYTSNLPTNWTHVESGIITGECGPGGSTCFRYETKYVQLLFLLNHGQTPSYEIEFDNLSLNKIE